MLPFKGGDVVSLKLLVALCAGEYDVDPHSHRLRGGCHQIICPFEPLHHKGHFGIRRFHRVQVVHIHFFYGLKKINEYWN